MIWLLVLALLLLPVRAMALDPWSGCQFMTAGSGATITCPDTTTGGATITATGTGTTWFTGNGAPATATGNNGDLYLDVVSGNFYTKTAGVWVLTGNLRGLNGTNGTPGASTGTYLVSGGNIAWVSGYTFEVGAATYYINGTLYTSTEQQITLSAADATNDRYDDIVLDTTGTVQHVNGTAAAPPFEPTIDPSLYVRLTTVLVTHSTSAPPAVVSIMIYDEGTGGEWTTSGVSSSLTVGSTNNPHTGSKDIEGTSVALGDSITFTKPSSSIDLATQQALVFYIRVKSAWPANKRMRLQWQNASGNVGQFVDVPNGNFGFNSQTNTTTYQQIVVPTNQFQVTPGNTVTKLVMSIVGGGASVGFYWDTIQLQAGLNNTPTTQPGGANQSIQFNNFGVFDGIAPTTDDQVLVSSGTAWQTKTLPNCTDTTGNHLNYTASTNAFSCGTSGNITATTCTNQVVSAVAATGAATCHTVVGGDMASATVTGTQLAVVQTRRVCAIVVGADNGSALANADLGPQGRQCFIPAAATIVEMTVAADGGTPNVIVGRNRAGSIVNIVSGALATASAGGIACSNTGATTGLDGTTTCSGTLQNTGLNAGDYLELVSGTAGATAKRMSIFVTYTIN